MKTRKRIISTMLCICLMFTALVSNVFGTTTASAATKNVTLMEKDKNIVKVKGEYNGDVLYGTLDRKTKEITLQAVEKSKSNNLLMLSDTNKKAETTNYKVKVHDSKKGQNTSADIINVETNEKFSFGSKDKVKAQAIFAAPLIEILGAAVIDALIEYGALIVVGGIDYALASEVSDTLEDKDYQYYMAYLDWDSNDVYIGNGIPYITAYTIVINNDIQNGVWAVNQQYAFDLADNVGYYARYDGKRDEEGYYYHYHATRYDHTHIWFS